MMRATIAGKSGALDAGIWLDVNKAFNLDDIGKAFGALEGREMLKALSRLAGAEPPHL